MSIFDTDALAEKDRQIAQIKKDQEVENTHRRAIESLKESHRDEVENFKEEIAELKATIAQHETDEADVNEKLEYERTNREALVDAKVQSELGKYETKYYHDLHTALEERADGMQKFTETMFDKILNAIKDNKPVVGESKVMILGKEVFGVDAKANAGKDNSKDQKQQG